MQPQPDWPHTLEEFRTCYGDEQPAAATMPPAPSFCCTAAGRFGPFPNPGWPEGSACWSQTVYGPMQGLACY